MSTFARWGPPFTRVVEIIKRVEAFMRTGFGIANSIRNAAHPKRPKGQQDACSGFRINFVH